MFIGKSKIWMKLTMKIEIYLHQRSMRSRDQRLENMIRRQRNLRSLTPTTESESIDDSKLEDMLVDVHIISYHVRLYTYMPYKRDIFDIYSHKDEDDDP